MPIVYNKKPISHNKELLRLAVTNGFKEVDGKYYVITRSIELDLSSGQLFIISEAGVSLNVGSTGYAVKGGPMITFDFGESMLIPTVDEWTPSN